jgi:DNA-binding Lrp family transcriptional regulator
LNDLSDVDRKMLKLLLQSEGKMHSHEISQELGVPISTVQRRRKRLEEIYLIKSYTLNPVKFGWRRIDFLIATEGGATMSVGKELLRRPEVTYVARSIGEHTIDLRVETFVQDNSELLNLLEDVKGMEGVKDVVWSEIVEVIGKKNPPNHLAKQLTEPNESRQRTAKESSTAVPIVVDSRAF